jgi:hypothetical protein
VFEPEPFGAVFEGPCEFTAEDFWPVLTQESQHIAALEAAQAMA